jgi:hypothetical protein
MAPFYALYIYIHFVYIFLGIAWFSSYDYDSRLIHRSHYGEKLGLSNLSTDPDH